MHAATSSTRQILMFIDGRRGKLCTLRISITVKHAPPIEYVKGIHIIKRCKIQRIEEQVDKIPAKW